MKAGRAAVRLSRTLWGVLAGYLTVLLRFPRLDPLQRQQEVQAWARRMLRALDVRLEVRGAPAAGPVLQVANHLSWLDILVLLAAGHCRFVSKADVRHWPFIGRMATGAGTLYIARESRRDAMRVVHRIAASVQAGEVVAVFPEGATGDGRTVLPFHANLLQAAISTQSPVQPVALDFIDAASRRRTDIPCFIGDDTLVSSAWRTITAEPLVAVVHYGPLQAAGGRDRRAWAEELQHAVAELRGKA
ncbi:1-acyl-sn-glycerol-3-phosphate acyltransferase [Ramlibacter sp. AW1]|uniref:1-acyl-sn-glycerol-3-phosphate acyltransferase n=1 Tax=Ramlibacter aurantiacus TaxID=2801330 RepID=A0A936ZRI9_9BURK|nr:lysophospholipid acyltransferase family protein [Ramlibacter aurantiacus]MBL0422163.1 1-acyl-sn-glycerol-3-phosphate acyltransferase [Ramlibacter aurantiacus]